LQRLRKCIHSATPTPNNIVEIHVCIYYSSYFITEGLMADLVAANSVSGSWQNTAWLNYTFISAEYLNWDRLTYLSVSRSKLLLQCGDNTNTWFPDCKD